MKKYIILVLIILTFGKMYSQKINQTFSTDIDNYWFAFDEIQKTKNSNKKFEIINRVYIGKASKGLKSFMLKRNYTDSLFIQNIEKYPKFWKSIRKNTLEIKNRNKEIEKAIKRLKDQYPNLKPAEIYFTIGGLRSGGTIDIDMVLIGSEIMVGNSLTDVSEFESDWLKNTFKSKKYNDIVYLTIHEYIHTQQKDGFVNLLGQSIREGSCDFIAELVLNKPIRTSYLDYGNANFEKVINNFIPEMFSTKLVNWLYNGNTTQNPDLGYFLGYEICKSYYQSAEDKKQAIKDIIELDYADENAVDAFLKKSKFFPQEIDKEKILLEYQKKMPMVIKIEPFENASKNVDVQTKHIKITFSKEMKDVSLSYSKNGKEHFPLSKQIGFENDSKTLILETVELKPKTKYDFYINDNNTESKDGYMFFTKEFKIEFETK